MIETRTRQDSRMTPPATAQAPTSGGGRARRAGARLWSLLHAPAFLSGGSGGPYDPAFIEDDYRRLAARRRG
jgi:hypothetical protein